jgi:hypothetical protein
MARSREIYKATLAESRRVYPDPDERKITIRTIADRLPPSWRAADRFVQPFTSSEVEGQVDTPDRGHGPSEWPSFRETDVSQSRLVPGAVDALRSTLDWAKLGYDEGACDPCHNANIVGPGIGGSKGPYVQVSSPAHCDPRLTT